MTKFRSVRSGITALISLAVVIAVAGCGSGPVAAPTTFSQYNAKDGTFACEYPDGWEAKGGGKNGPLWATFASGAAEIRVNADLAGSLMGDMAGVGIAGGDMVSSDLEPVAKVHEIGKQSAAQKYDGYQELGSAAELSVSLGPARRSEFTAATAFGSGLHGYRATILGHNKRVVVYCVCAESDWQTLQPGFDHVLESFTRGNPE